MFTFKESAIELVRQAEVKRIDLTAEREGWHQETKAGLRVFIIMSAYILGNEKAYLSSNAEGAPIYEVTYNAATDDIYFVTYKQTAKETIYVGGDK